MTTKAPKLPRDIWLKIQQAPKRIYPHYPVKVGENDFKMRDGTIYRGGIHPTTGKQIPWTWLGKES